MGVPSWDFRLGIKPVKAELLLCEAAAAHPDGTVSMLRVGTNVVSGALPLPFSASLVALVQMESGDGGVHDFDVQAIDIDGRHILPTIKGQVTTPNSEGRINLLMPINVQISQAGKFEFVLRIDRQIKARCPLIVVDEPSKEAPKK